MHLHKTYAWALVLILAVCIAGCGGGGDSDRLRVSATTPDDGVTNVPINTIITAVFDETLDVTTVNDTTFLVNQAGTDVAGTVAAAGKTVIFTPSADLLPDTEYVVTLTTGIRDLDGDRLNSNKVWTFTTGATTSSQADIDLGAAAFFAVLAGTNVTNSGASTITGDGNGHAACERCRSHPGPNGPGDSIRCG